MSTPRTARPADLVEVRLVGTPAVVEAARRALAERLAERGGRIERSRGPYPARRSPGRVRVYLVVRLAEAGS